MQLSLLLSLASAAFTLAQNSTLPAGFVSHKSVPICYHDEDGNHRVLKGKPANDIAIHDITVSRCLRECKNAGYGSAGLEYGKECYCGCSVPKETPKGPLDECMYPCKGDERTFCGGNNRILVYDI